MDLSRLTQALAATVSLVSTEREHAEKYLDEVHKIIGFCPSLLQIVMTTQDQIIQQAGVIYLKNQVNHSWREEDPSSASPNEPLPYSIHEHDKQAMRAVLIEAIIQAPEKIRHHLVLILNQICKTDFPSKWPDLPQTFMKYVQSDNRNVLSAVFLAILNVAKVFEFKRDAERQPLNELMWPILPIMTHQLEQVLPETSIESNTLVKTMMKLFFTIVQFVLSLELVSRELLAKWVELCQRKVALPIAPECVALQDRDEMASSVWWKGKKWALHVLYRITERYGSPNSSKQYKQFAQWYGKAFSMSLVQCIVVNVFQPFRQAAFVAPRILQQALNLCDEFVRQSFSWKFLRPFLVQTGQGDPFIIPDVIFKLLCHSPEDQELWTSDPLEFVQAKYDVMEDYLNPASAATAFLRTAATKRKAVLDQAVQFCVMLLNQHGRLAATWEAAVSKDAALHIIGSLNSLLIEKELYRNKLEEMIVHFVLPEFGSQFGFLRARACWVLGQFAEVTFTQTDTLPQSVQALFQSLKGDQDLPVRIEAALAMMNLIQDQEFIRDSLKPLVPELLMCLLALLKETQIDDLTEVLDQLVNTYEDEVKPVAVQLCAQIADAFISIVQEIAQDEANEDEESDTHDTKTITAIGLVNTLDTLLTRMETHVEILQQMEPIVLRIVRLILQTKNYGFYEETFNLILSLTTVSISPAMWEIFEILCQLFQDEDGDDYFQDMMPSLHNYVTIGSEHFLSDRRYLTAVLDICQHILGNDDAGTDSHCHAAKLLEVLLINYKGQIDDVVPRILTLVLSRLAGDIQITELRQMLLQVIVAALYYNPQSTLALLRQMAAQMQPAAQGAPNSEAIVEQFVGQLVHDSDCFLGIHDRKMFVLGLSLLMEFPAAQRPAKLVEVAKQMVPALLLVFDGLKRAYKSRAEANQDSDSEDDADDMDTEKNSHRNINGNQLDSDEDDLTSGDEDYLDQLDKQADEGEEDEDDEDDDSDEDGETILESYYETWLDDEEKCTVDEYVYFRDTLHKLEQQDGAFLRLLTESLTAEQQQQLMEVMTLAEQKQQAIQSKQIKLQGGYQFGDPTTVPTSFNFSAS